MTDSPQYAGTTAGELKDILSHIVSPSTRNHILEALRENGILSGGQFEGGLAIVNDPKVFTEINANKDQAVVLGPNSATVVSSNGPIVIATSSGSNYVDISHSNHRRDQADTVIGGAGRDYIQGNSAAALLQGGAGHETIVSGGGKDTLVGGSGFDTLTGGGHSYIQGGTGTATIRAGLSGASHDTVYAGTGVDKITLTAGDNVVHGPIGAGVATIRAGSGMDTIYGGSGQQLETIVGGGKTTLNLSSGDVTFKLNSGNNDTIFGGTNTGTVSLNKASGDILSTSSTTVKGQQATTITFSSGGTITTVGNVNLVSSDHKKLT